MHITNILVAQHSLSKETSTSVQKSLASVPTARSVLCRLPVEIVTLILELAYYNEDLDPDYQFLLACALVCRSWSAPSQALLFNHVALRSSSAFLAFRSAVDATTVRGRTLRSNVVRLRIIIDHNHPDQLSHHALAIIVLSCPNLYELDLAIFGCGVPTSSTDGSSCVRIFRAAPSFDTETLNLFRAGPSIRSMKFANWSDNDQLAIQLLSDVWPALTAVSLRGTPPRLPAFDDSPLLPFGCPLSELRFGFQVMPCPDFISWLMQNSNHSLRHLELERLPTTDVLEPLLSGCGPSLESLAFPSCTSRDQGMWMHGCKKLKEFRFESSNISPLLLSQLPATVEHLAFSISRDTPLYLMVNLVKTRPHLKVVTVHVWVDAASHPQMPSLRIACACNGVELVVVRGIRKFREAVRGDPIPCPSYPCLKEPANFRRMFHISRHAREGEPAKSSTRRQRPRAESASAMLTHPVLSELAGTNEVAITADAQRKKQ
ncbi:hypothetical protein ACEPAG_289 [Sanghuangporus baumii]